VSLIFLFGGSTTSKACELFFYRNVPDTVWQ